MIVASTSDFRKQMKRYVDQIHNDHVPLILTRSDNVTVVIQSLDDYNALTETEYLNRSKANRRQLEKSIAQLRAGKTITKTMQELRTYEQGD